MTKLPGFKYSNPSNDYERLAKELIDDLNEITRAFTRVNSAYHTDQILPNAIVCGLLGHCGSQLLIASKYLEEGGIPEFVSECRDVFNRYMDVILEEANKGLCDE